ncbi:MAG: Ger(x)C family spore germination protein [Limnochordaceae bacterium]|nr:Ger(x)C family spore germination protein [Limnochordaceae bacterium]
MFIVTHSGRQTSCRPIRYGQGAALVAAALSLSLSVAGCWDRTEINELAIVFASAVDYEDGQWINTAGFIRTASQGAATGATGAGGSGGGGGGGPARFTVTVQAPTIREAHAKLALFVSRRIHWDHATAVLVGEQAARQGIEPVLDLWTRETDLRTTALVFLTRGKAQDVLLAAQPGLEASLGQGLTRLADVASSVGLAQPTELHSLVTRLASESHTAVVPLVGLVALPQPAPPDTPAAGGGSRSPGSRGGSNQRGPRSQGGGRSPVPSRSDPALVVQPGRTLPPSVPAATLQIQGAGVFREGRLVTLLSPSQVRGLLWVTSPSQEIVLSIRRPRSRGSPANEERDATVAVMVESAKPSLQVRPDQASIRLRVQVRLVEQDSWRDIRTPSGTRARGTETDMSDVTTAVSRQIEQEIRSVLKATQPLGADVYSLAGVLHRQNKEAWHEVERRWPQILRTLPVKVNVETVVVGSGESISPPTVRFEGGA